jgi:choice-of-anchor C domain-containing protein
MKKLFTLLTALIGVAVTLTGQRVCAASFTNGSFELGSLDANSPFVTLFPGDTSIQDWSIVGANSVDYIGSFWVASDGARSIDMSGLGPGTIEQTFDTTPGATYKVTFDLAGNSGGNATAPDQSVKSLQASIDSVNRALFSFDTTGRTNDDMGWVTMDFTFTAAASTSTLGFSSLSDSAFGPALDNVSMSVVPVAPAALFMLSGLLSFAGLKRSFLSKGQ